jgi:hypothetical protein
VVNAIELNGDETEDSVVQRQYFMLEPEPPTAFPGLAGKTRFRTDGFKYCSEVGSAWTMVEWVLL